jgi:membrane fusion protein (multidrug efflux system)
MAMTGFRWAALLVLLAAAGGSVYAFWLHEKAYPSTSDAYMTAHVVRIEPQIGGRVLKLPVRDHQYVVQGQLLMQIDARPYRIAEQQAQAGLTLARQQQLAADAALSAAGASVRQRQAQLDNARRTYERDTRLLARQVVSQAQADADHDKLREAEAQLHAAQAAYQESLREQGEAGARIDVARAALDRARLNLSYTRISAPAPGTLGRLQVRPGDVVQDAQQLFPLVEDRTFWVDANYKETDLERIRPGQPATISMDMYPDKTFQGVVESLSPASGAAFSLLPPENATGNWVKVTQRFPVRVRVIRHSGDPPLRIGASCDVTIDTTRTVQNTQLSNHNRQRPDAEKRLSDAPETG